MAKTTNNDLQNSTQKTKDRVTQTTLNTGGELGCYVNKIFDEENILPINRKRILLDVPLIEQM
jgi:hypothetical protein